MLARYQAEGVLKSGDPLLHVASLLGPLVMRFAVGRTQPVIAANFAAEDMVAPFLLGWRAAPPRRADECIDEAWSAPSPFLDRGPGTDLF